MKRFHSIKKNKDFQLVYREGKSYANRYLIMYVRKTEGEITRIGISASKKVGNSVVRHRMTRLVRECFRLNENILKTGLDIVVVVRPTAKEQHFKSIESAYLHLCGLHNIKRESK
ncbi:ribonuclease P protein component [Lachnospiraceae bacterium 62-35]